MSDRVGPSWELFIDESGELEPGGGASQLCGMLVDGNAALPSSRNLRPALRLAFPSIAYPPHASYLTTVSGYVGCWVRGGEPTEERAPVAILAECARLLRTAPALAHFDAWRTLRLMRFVPFGQSMRARPIVREAAPMEL